MSSRIISFNLDLLKIISMSNFVSYPNLPLLIEKTNVIVQDIVIVVCINTQGLYEFTWSVWLQ